MKNSKIDYTQFKFPKGKINKEDKEKGLKTNLKRNKPIKKVSKHKIKVSEETYQKVYERDKGICQLKDKNCEFAIHLHHIVYKSEDKSKIDDPSNCILLCSYHHRLVHSNKHYWKPILLKKIKK